LQLRKEDPEGRKVIRKRKGESHGRYREKSKRAQSQPLETEEEEQKGSISKNDLSRNL